MTENNIFTQDFLNLDYKIILDEVKKNGFFSFDNALSEDFVNNIIDDVKRSGLSLNTNNVGGVYYTHGNQFFLTHMLAVSKSFFDYCTNSKVFDICTNYLGDKFRLKALRYYENFGLQNMQWHTDNRYHAINKKGGTNTKTPGLIFLSYVADVEDGEFQYIKGSHLWSTNNQHNDYTQEYIEKNFSKDIVGFKKPKGSIIIYDTFGIHRAKPSKDKNFVRKSLFFQVDEEIHDLDEAGLVSEPILIKTEYLDKFNDKIKLFLGFGKKSSQKIYPTTSLDTMPMNKQTFAKMSTWYVGRIAHKLPGFLRKRIRKLFGISTNK